MLVNEWKLISQSSRNECDGQESVLPEGQLAIEEEEVVGESSWGRGGRFKSPGAAKVPGTLGSGVKLRRRGG